MYLPSKADLSLYLNLQIHPGPSSLKATEAALLHLCKLRLLPWSNQKSIPIRFNFHEWTYIFSIFQSPGISLTGCCQPGPPLDEENALDGMSRQKHAPARTRTLRKGYKEAVHIPGYSYASRVREHKTYIERHIFED